MSEEISRRICVEKMTPAELAIRAALLTVEGEGCDPRLTEAVVLLGRAQGCVADFVDGVPIPPPMDLPPDVLECIDRALNAAQEGWQQVDGYQLDGIVISSKALHIAVEALRKHLHDPKCWEGK